MYRNRLHIVSLFCLWSLLAMSQSHDFEVRDFRENPTDLSAVSTNVKDINGRTAALIRFAARDTLFTFEANNGIIKQKKAVGEVQLYVPQGTKRITIRHPHLGILRDYQLPVYIMSKTTYDAEIVITNAGYMSMLFQNPGLMPQVSNPPTVEQPTETETAEVQPEADESKEESEHQVPMSMFSLREKKQKEADKSQDDVPKNQENAEKTLDDAFGAADQPLYGQPINDDGTLLDTLKTKKPHTPLKVSCLLGGGYNAVSIAGPSISAGIHLGKLIFSADMTIGTQKVENVGIYYKQKGKEKELSEIYDYSVNRFSLRLGVGSQNLSVQMVPLVGVSFNMIKGKEIANNKGDKEQFSESYPISLSLALSLRIRLYKPLHLTVTPQYDFALGADDVWKVIKDSDRKIKTWAEGFGVNAGLLFSF